MLITDRKGQEVTRVVYTPFGEVYEDDDNDGKDSYGLNASTFKYTGQELDESTGLAYYGARYYDPVLGRFLTPDPIVPDWTHSQNLNRYVYVRNNPIIYEDPTGNFEILGRALVGAGIGIAIEVGLEYAYGNGNYGQAIAKGAIAGSVAAMTGAGVIALAEKVSKIGKAVKMSEKILKGTTVATGDVLGGGVGAVTSGIVDVVQGKSPPNLNDTVPEYHRQYFLVLHRLIRAIYHLPIIMRDSPGKSIGIMKLRVFREYYETKAKNNQMV